MEKERKYYYFLLLLLICTTLFPYINTGYTTNDDMSNALIDYSDFINFAKNQGRYHFMSLHGLVAFGTHAFGSHVTVKTISLFSVVLNVALFGILIFRLTGAEVFSIFCTFFWVAFLHDSWGHFLITSSPLIYTLPLSLFFISILFFMESIEKNSNKSLIVSAIIYFCALQFSEMFVLFIVFFVLIFFFKNKSGFQQFKYLLPHITALSLFLLIYIVFRINYPSQYAGNAINFNEFSIQGFFETLKEYSLSGFRLEKLGNRFSPFFYNRYIFNNAGENLWVLLKFVLYNLRHLSRDWIVKSLIVSFVSILLLNRHVHFIKKKDCLFILLLSIAMTFLPNVPVAITPKYQDWVTVHGSRTYIGTYYSLFGLTLFLSGIIFFINDHLSNRNIRRIYLSILAVVIFGASVSTSINNDIQLKSKAMSHKKWELIDKFILSDQFKNMNRKSIVYAYDLVNKHLINIAVGWGGNYWERYIKKKTGKELLIGGDVRTFLDMKRQHPESDLYFLKYSQNYNSPEQYLVFSRVKKYDFSFASEDSEINLYSDFVHIFTHSVNTRYLVLLNTKTGVSVVKYLDDKLINNNDVIYIEKNDIHLNSVMATNNMDFYVPAPNKLNRFIPVRYGQGFYNKEKRAEDTWRWSKRDSEMYLVNPYSFDVKVKVGFILASGLVDDPSVHIKTKNYEERYVPTSKGLIIKKEFTLEPGENVIAFHSDSKKIFHNVGEPRDLYFGIFNFKILATE